MSLSKLTIRSRPLPLNAEIGNGAFRFALTSEQVTLLTALVSHCRLGAGTPYSDAAYEIISEIEETFGEDYMVEACDAVGLRVSIEDSSGYNVTTTTVNDGVTFEV